MSDHEEIQEPTIQTYPCANCGSKAGIWPVYGLSKVFHFIQCSNPQCCMRTPSCETVKQAITIWERRTAQHTADT